MNKRRAKVVKMKHATRIMRLFYEHFNQVAAQKLRVFICLRHFNFFVVFDLLRLGKVHDLCNTKIIFLFVFSVAAAVVIENIFFCFLWVDNFSTFALPYLSFRSSIVVSVESFFFGFLSFNDTKGESEDEKSPAFSLCTHKIYWYHILIAINSLRYATSVACACILRTLMMC